MSFGGARTPYGAKTGSKNGPNGTAGAQSLSGFGLTHDGHDAGLLIHFDSRRFLPVLTNNAQAKLELAAYLMCYDTGIAPAVGYTCTLTAKTVNDPATPHDWNLLEIQPSANIGLIVKGRIGGVCHGLLNDRTTRLYQTDQSGWGPLSHDQLVAGILAGGILTLMGVPPTSKVRMSIDRNANGVLDADEVPPPLAATFSSAGLVISWPTNSIGMVLEFCEDLVRPEWKLDTNEQTTTADHLFVTVPGAATHRFFRLRRLE